MLLSRCASSSNASASLGLLSAVAYATPVAHLTVPCGSGPALPPAFTSASVSLWSRQRRSRLQRVMLASPVALGLHCSFCSAITDSSLILRGSFVKQNSTQALLLLGTQWPGTPRMQLPHPVSEGSLHCSSLFVPLTPAQRLRVIPP